MFFGVALALFALAASGQDLGDQIRTAQASGKYAEAARLYQQLISSGSDTPEIRSNCGMMLQLAGKSREAMDQFRIALQKDPSLASANLFAGLAELDLGAPQAALGYLQKARELDPERPMPLLALGRAHIALRQFDRANEEFTKATTMTPTVADAWYGAGLTDRSLADEILNRATRAGATKKLDQQKASELLEKALDALSRAIALEPNAARTHLMMAESFADAGKQADAIREYEATIRLDPQSQGAYLGLASLYWKQRQFDEARPLLKRVLAKSPKDPEANAIMADILQHDGRSTEAERLAQLALLGNPDLIETRVVLARVYLDKNEPKLAISQLQKVISADPDGSYHFLLYRAYRQAGDAVNAKLTLAQFQRIRASRPGGAMN